VIRTRPRDEDCSRDILSDVVVGGIAGRVVSVAASNGASEEAGVTVMEVATISETEVVRVEIGEGEVVMWAGGRATVGVGAAVNMASTEGEVVGAG